MSRKIFLAVGVLCCCLFLGSLTTQAQPPFKAISDSLAPFYKFDLQKNFFRSEDDFQAFMKKFATKVSLFDLIMTQKQTAENLEAYTLAISALEYNFRKIDLYLFLKYAVNTTDQPSSDKEDSVYQVMLVQRNKFRNFIGTAPATVVETSLSKPGMQPFNYYIRNIIKNKLHELSPLQTQVAKPFSYLKDNRYYDELVNSIRFEKIKTPEAELDPVHDRGLLSHHPDPVVVRDAEVKLFKGYETIKEPLGNRYIQMIRGLSAFSKLKNYKSFVDETFDKLSLSEESVLGIFKEMEKNAYLFKERKTKNVSEDFRYTIGESSAILQNSFKQLGNDYYQQASRLLDPRNGRLDIAGGPNRMGMQGAASVYPIDVSTFFAYRYEGYFIDLMVLAHESGHAIQSSLMHGNKVSLLNSSGPGYFTESFGKFNELLVAYNLLENAADTVAKSFYTSKYLERLLVLFGAAEEAAIEYNLVKAIESGKINRVYELDSICFLVGSKYSDYNQRPEQKGLWMLLETNFKAPLHNTNDMMAALLSISYFQQFLTDRKVFSEKYAKFLRNGYTAAPSRLLKDFMGIDVHDPELFASAIDFIKHELQRFGATR